MNMNQNEPQFNLPIAAASSAPLTMSSREIAEVVDSRHDDVKRSIVRLVQRGVIVQPPMADEQDIDALGRQRTTSVYRVSKRDSYVVVAQLSPEFTARLVDRWQELEDRAAKPALPDFSDPVVAARAWADALERKQAAETRMIEAQRLVADLTPKAEAYEAYLSEEGVCRISDFCNKHGVKVNRPGYILRAKGYMHQKKALATQSGLKTGILKNVLEKNGFEYIDAKGQSVESQLIMIVRQREIDLLKMIVDAYGETAFRNPAAFLRAKNSLTGG